MPLAPTEEMLREARESLPELPAARIERYVGELGLAADAAALLAADPETAAYFEQVRGGGRRRRAAGASPTGSPASWPRRCARAARTAARRTPRSSPSALAALVAHGPGEEDLPRQRQDRARDAGRRGRRPGRDRRARGPRPDRPTAASWRRSSPPRSRPTPRPPSRSAPATSKAIGAIVGAVMRETKGRADGGEVNRLIRRSWACRGAGGLPGGSSHAAPGERTSCAQSGGGLPAPLQRSCTL